MRLIDADKLIYSEYTDMFDEPIVFDTVTKKRVYSMPTIEAIPTEWIRKYTNHRTVEFGDIWVFVNCMINDWEKENETNRQE